VIDLVDSGAFGRRPGELSADPPSATTWNGSAGGFALALSSTASCVGGTLKANGFFLPAT
jgi:hypothetical protein